MITKWQLKYTDSWDEAKKLAEEGWEMCGASNQGDLFMITYYYFKQPL